MPDIFRHDVGIYFRGLHIRMAETLLGDPDVDALFKHVRGE